MEVEDRGVEGGVQPVRQLGLRPLILDVAQEAGQLQQIAVLIQAEVTIKPINGCDRAGEETTNDDCSS